MHSGVTAGAALAMCISNKTFDPYERGLVQDVIDARIDPTQGSADLFV